MNRSKVNKSVIVLLAQSLFISIWPAYAEYPAANSFTVLTYNVAGLPELISSSDPSDNTSKISHLLNDYDIVAVQEDFAYHDELIKNVTSPYLTSHTGNVPFGDGMNFISKLPFNDCDRVTWRKRHGFFVDGADENIPKGFMYARFQLEPNVYVDVYTAHADANCDHGSMEARRDNMEQLAQYINTHSAGNAVIVMGDLNSRYTREGDNFETALLQAYGLQDVWIKLIRNGIVPPDSTSSIKHANHINKIEFVDKVFYRSSKALALNPVNYNIEIDKFLDFEGPLSDHNPLMVRFKYTKATDISFSETFGGSGGTAFNYLANQHMSSRPAKLSIKTGKRVDNVSMTYSDGTVFSNGGDGGDLQSIDLAGDEYINQVTVCNGYHESDRIFYIECSTNRGQVLFGGTRTCSRKVYTAPKDYYIAGFFGRSRDEVDQLGVIFRPLKENYYKITARHSGKSLDVKDFNNADNAEIIQWPYCGGINQQWSITSVGDGFYRILSRSSSKALDVSNISKSDGAHVIQWSYWGGDNQLWYIADLGNGFYKLISKNSKKALDVCGESRMDGATITQWTYNGGDNQQWKIEEIR